MLCILTFAVLSALHIPWPGDNYDLSVHGAHSSVRSLFGFSAVAVRVRLLNDCVCFLFPRPTRPQNGLTVPNILDVNANFA